MFLNALYRLQYEMYCSVDDFRQSNQMDTDTPRIKIDLSNDVASESVIKPFLICFPMNYRDFSVKINGENENKR